jgi:glycosyltransferase involved in cell wall biosynthesis
LETRELNGLPRNKLQSYPTIEIAYQLRQTFSSIGAEEGLHRRNEAFQRAISDHDLESADVVIGFDTSSWLLSRRAKQIGKKFVLDQSIGHPVDKERIFAGIRDNFPEWNLSIPHKLPAHVAEEIEEHRLADLVVVPSSFVRSTLLRQGVAESKIRIIPFGTDLRLFHPADVSKAQGAFVFLFVGSISARKGLPVLLEAWRRMPSNSGELWVVGVGALPEQVASNLPTSVRFLGQKSRFEVAKLMRQADAFVFPSFFEGLAQVQIEAMASGLPIISTIEAGAEDLVRDGENGFLVPAGDVFALTERMEQMAADRTLFDAMRKSTISERNKLDWKVYGDRWAKVLDELI